MLKRSRLVNEIKSERGCKVCGERRAPCLDFHHQDQTTKCFSISAGISGLYSISAILAEIEKCNVLCANCHRLEHWDAENQTWLDLKWRKSSSVLDASATHLCETSYRLDRSRPEQPSIESGTEYFGVTL